MSTHSPGFIRFRESVEDPVSNSAAMRAFNLSALLEIRDDEYRAAVELLRKPGEKGDPRVVEALVAIGTDEAWAMLMKLLDGPPTVVTLTAAHLVWVERRAAEAIDALERCITRGEPDAQALALRTLGRVEMPLVDLALQALQSEHRTVRLAASEAILARLSLDGYDNIIGSPIYNLTLGIGSELLPMYVDAARSLSALAEKIEEGQSPESLGLVVENSGISSGVQSLWEAVDGTAPLDPGLVKRLTPGEADYAVEYLSRGIERGDVRVIPLLAAIGTRRAKLALGDHA